MVRLCGSLRFDLTKAARHHLDDASYKILDITDTRWRSQGYVRQYKWRSNHDKYCRQTICFS